MSESVKTKTNLVRTAAKGEQVRTSIADAIDEIDDHVDEVFETEFVAVDPTLSISGNGADARVTGDEFCKINDVLVPLFTFPRKANNTTGEYSIVIDTNDTTRARYQIAFNGVSVKVVMTNSDYIYRVVIDGPNGHRYYAPLSKEYASAGTPLVVSGSSLTSIIVQFKHISGRALTDDDINNLKSAFRMFKLIKPYSICGKTEPGNLGTFNDIRGYLSNSEGYRYSRSRMVYSCFEKAVVDIVFDSEQISDIKYVYIHCYDDSKDFLQSIVINGPFYDGVATFKIPEGCAYFKFIIDSQNSSYPKARNEKFMILSDAPISEKYNFNFVNPSITKSLAFNYEVSDGMSSGRLLLPSNYSIVGKKVPLIVFVHGSASMTTWDSILGATSSGDYFPYLQYLANEGFAVFDCYPWTNKESLSATYSPINLPVIKDSYLSGIRYVCDRFNVDINRVSLLCKSQGGHLGHWALTQSEFPFKAVCLFAPAVGAPRDNLFYNSNVREAMTKYMDLDGTSTEISDFISSGSYSTNANVQSFFNKNKIKFISILPWVQGVTNGNIDEFYSDETSAATSTVPQWLLDLGLPAKPDGTSGMQVFVRRSNYVKHATCPTKFWCAFDDNSVSAYCNYAIYYWLCNGGADTEFRELPIGTGGHHAMDTSPNALKSSGTTKLGIAYTDIPTAYVEVVDFIRNKCGE